MVLTVGVIGAGAMGTAISQILAENANTVYLYARNKEICNEVNNSNHNSIYYPNIKLKKNIIGINDFEKLTDTDIIFLCVPSSTIREITIKLNKIISEKCIIVTTAKGIEHDTNKRMTEIIEEISNKPPVALSGPNIASEMIKNLPSATTIACKNENYLKYVKQALETQKFKVNANTDVIGTEFCGVIKNVIAISQGILEGLNINDNARFALFTKSYKEVKKFIEKIGGNGDTVDDYCGFGDIITASTFSVSRNHTLGVLHGQGIVIDEKASGVLFEGKNTVKIIKKICEENDIEFLTNEFTYDVIINKKNPKLAYTEFWEKI